MTAQIHEILILDGERTSMAFCPPLPIGDARFELTEIDKRAIRLVSELWEELSNRESRQRYFRPGTSAYEAATASRREEEASLREEKVAEALREAEEEQESDSPALDECSRQEVVPYPLRHLRELHQCKLPRGATAEQLNAAVDAALLGEGYGPPGVNSACWRGYQGTWEVREDRFYLVRVMGRPTFLGRQPIFADWFTGVLRIPRGRCLEYVHMGFGSYYEEELHIKIEAGVVTQRRTLTARDIASRIHPLDNYLRSFPGSENRFPGDDEM